MFDYFYPGVLSDIELLAKINVADIYVSTAGYKLQLIYICQFKNIGQQYRLANPDYNNISIDKYRREILPTVMV